MSNAKAKHEHESFEVKDKPRREAVRPDRIEATDGSFRLRTGQGEFEVGNYSAFGVAITSDGPIAFGSAEISATFVVEGVDVGALQLRPVRSEPMPTGGMKHAFEIISSPLSLEKIEAVLEAKQLVAAVVSESAEYVGVPEAFRRGVLEAKDILEKLERRLTEMSRSRSFTSSDEGRQFEDVVAEVVSQYLFALFNPAYKQLGATLAGLKEAELKASVDFFRAKLGHLLYQSPFAERSYSKPLGYAGDYEMMNQIYRNENSGNSLFAKCLHRYYLDHPETKAVRNRAGYLFGKIFALLKTRATGRPMKILSVASGPAKEIQMLLREAPDLDLANVEIHLLDQDIVSLKHAQQKIREIQLGMRQTVTVKYVNKAIRNVIGRGLDEGGYDLIYSAGLFDYFSDPVATMGAKRLFDSVSPGGRLIVGNFNLTSPHQFLMNIALDWHLIYRSHDDLRRLFGELTPRLEIEQEPESVNLFCNLYK